jgi:hypothetical protein
MPPKKTLPLYKPKFVLSSQDIAEEWLKSRTAAHMQHPASVDAARSLRLSIFAATRAAALNKAEFETDVDLNTHLNTSLSDLARILFGDVVIQLFSNAHKYFTARELFEFSSVPSQCKGTIGLPIYGKDVCWICGIELDNEKYGMYNECEHVLPVAQAAYFLALYGPEYIKLNKEYNKLKQSGSEIPETFEKLKQIYEHIFKSEYAHSHAACNRKKNDMCGISAKLNVATKIPFAAVNDVSIKKLLTEIYNDTGSLFSMVGPRIRRKYVTLDAFISARYPIFNEKYVKICQFLNQCGSFNGTTFTNDKNCLYKFNALCVAGAGAVVAGMVERKKDEIAKYTKDANAFIGDKKYLIFLGYIYARYQQLFIIVYNELYNICEKYIPSAFTDVFKLPKITRLESYQHIAHEYFRIASSVPQLIYLENMQNILTGTNYSNYINNIANAMIGIFLRERCDLIVGKDSFKVFPLDMRKELDEKLITLYTKNIDKILQNERLGDLTNTHVYMNIASNYNDRLKYDIDNIITLKLKVAFPEPPMEGGGRTSKTSDGRPRPTHHIMNSSRFSFKRPQAQSRTPFRIQPSYTPEQLGYRSDANIRLQNIERDVRAARRGEEREKRYNQNMLIGINAITTIINDTNITPDFTEDILINDFKAIYSELYTLEAVPAPAPAPAAAAPVAAAAAAALMATEGGKRTADTSVSTRTPKRGGTVKRRNKRHIKTRKYKK